MNQQEAMRRLKKSDQEEMRKALVKKGYDVTSATGNMWVWKKYRQTNRNPFGRNILICHLEWSPGAGCWRMNLTQPYLHTVADFETALQGFSLATKLRGLVETAWAGFKKTRSVKAFKLYRGAHAQASLGSLPEKSK